MSRAKEIFHEAFDGLDRLAPGSDESTARALSIVRAQFEPGRILDVGCGSGAQTLVLTRDTEAEIVAVDSHSPSLRVLENRAAAAGFRNRVSTVDMSMLELAARFAVGSFDVLWAEGSIYVMGFDAGLAAWRGLLREGGMLACTELCWLTRAPSEAARGFWGEAYPAMRSIEANIDAVTAAGYASVDHFVLPSSDWKDAYYGPLAARLANLAAKYAGDAEALGVLGMIQAEIDLYSRAGDQYGYVFYILRRVDTR